MHTLKYIKVLRAMQMLICIALGVLISYESNGQDGVKTDSILIKEMYSLLDREDYDKALEISTRAAEQFIKNENWEALLVCQEVLFKIGFYGDSPDSVQPQIKKYHTFFSDSMVREKAYSTYYLASIEDESGNILNGLKYYQSVIKLLQNKNDLNLLKSVYNDLGNIYTKFGDYSRAMHYLNASKEINLTLEDNESYSNNIFNLAQNAFFRDDYLECKKLYYQYLKLQPEDKGEVFFYLSELKTFQNELDSARFYFTKANRFKNGAISDFEFNDLYADILCKEGNLDGAINFMAKNEAEIQLIENTRTKGRYYYKLADLYSQQGKLEKAEENFGRALPNFSSQNVTIDSLDILTQKTFLFHEIWLGDVLIGLSNIYRMKFRDDKQERFKEKSKECIDLALLALDYKRSFFEDIESSLFSNKKSKHYYESAIETYLEWYEKNGKKEYLNSAFEIAQRHNAFILRQQINERVTLDKYKIGNELKKQYLNQKLKVLEISYALGNDYSQSGFENLKLEETKLDSITTIINEKHPLFQSSKNDFTVTSTQQIQKQLNKKKAVIKYFEGSEKLYSFVITKKKISYYVHENINEVKEQIGHARSILSSFSYSTSDIDSIEKGFLKVSFQLHENLLSQEIESLPKGIKNLIIIPTGSLTQIPFESFVTGKEKSWIDPSQYVSYDYAISYNYFCKELASPTIRKELHKVLSYGLEYDEYTLNASKKMSNDSISEQIIEKFRSEEMGHLYFADDEANEIAAMFGGVSFTNENATKNNFLSNVLDFDIIHLSAHSFVDFQYPSNSSIIFSKKDSLTDNMLRIKDVDRLTLDGQLFTLSACNTFYGKKNEGEGLSSMARSFIQSGAGSVVGSFWSVPDEISKSFMVHFYSKLKEGLPKDEALQATKIDFMTDDDLSSPLYRSPAYWSAWVIYGDTQSIRKSKSWMMYFGLGILLLGILFFLKYRHSTA